jgi:NTE family protein
MVIKEAYLKRQANGGLADNVPIKALAARGCTHVIIIHLQNGSLWSRYDFPAQTVIEIRPEQRINKSDTPILGRVDTFLDFSATRITDLQQRGYEDAKRCLEPIVQTFSSVGQQRQTQQSFLASTQQLLDEARL